MALEVNYPVAKATWAEKIAHVEVMREELRLQHNANGVAFGQDAQGNPTPEWITYKQTVWQPKHNALNMELNKLKRTPSAQDISDVDLDKDFKTAIVIGP